MAPMPRTKRKITNGTVAAAMLLAVLDGSALAAEGAANGSTVPYNPERNAYFGDLHLHTSMSADAAASFTKTLPEDAYRFAMGEAVEYFGDKVRRKAPLDFLAVTDHAEYLGMVREASDPNGPFAGTDWPAKLAKVSDDMMGILRIFSPAFRGEKPIPDFMDKKLMESNWQREIAAAQKYYRPGKFTTFVAYEWSPLKNGHMHRNVIFRGPNYPDLPFSAINSLKPEDLWTYIEANRAKGIEAILIPHNSNLSRGMMFAYKDSYGNMIDRAYAERRVRNERIVEITQNKGTSETRPEFSPADEFADFELLAVNPKSGIDQRGGYVRPAFKRGLEIESRTGVNPFEFGLIGSSDYHTGISATEEFNFPGGMGIVDAQTDRKKIEQILSQPHPIMHSRITILSTGGLAGIWAEENTRESLFDAMQRREVFATTGGRIRIRMFAGWNYSKGLTKKTDWVRQAYDRGVVMGADLPGPGKDGAKKPTFLFDAIKDPDGGNLDRLQIVKVWNADGKSHEKVIDVLWSGDRKRDPKTGKVPPVGNTVDVATATYTNSIGAVELKGQWTDPDFDPKVSAIYYARVLEIPTPRWPTYLAVRNNLPIPDNTPPSFQERAWTSPVFYKGTSVDGS